MLTPRELLRAYENGQNISALLRESQGEKRNTEDIIEVAYDLQTGSYIAGMGDARMARHKSEYTARIAEEIAALGSPDSLLEAGVGEATTLAGVIRNLGLAPAGAYGFDISWSRVAYARTWLEGQNLGGVHLCTGSLFHLPFADDSVELVYTSHSIEPNGGNEEPILRELYRVTRKWLMLLEPAYELAGPQARQRMEAHGYCRNLPQLCRELGWEVLRHEIFPCTANPLNPTALTLVRKPEARMRPQHVLACPRFRTPLQELGGMLYSPEALVVYPVLCGIPCLRPESAIIASKYPEFFPEVP